MQQQKGFFLINLSGLTLGITCCVLILLFITDELSFDNFHRDAFRTYRLAFRGVLEGKNFSSAQTGTPVSMALQAEIPDVESTIRLANWLTFPVRYEDIAYTEERMLLADSNFFNFFDFSLIYGHPDSVLLGPGKIVLTESTAKRYFGNFEKGDTSLIGKTLNLAQGYAVKVSGIATDPPVNSHLHFTMITSMSSWDDVKTGTWISPQVITYFKLRPNEAIETVVPKFNQLLEKNVTQELIQPDSGDNSILKQTDLEFFAQPLRKIHLHSHLSDEIQKNGDIQYIYIFGSIAFFIITLACINFMNLSTARSASRAKEVGIRKAVGAQNSKLVLQFLLESYLYVIISVMLSVFLTIALIPVLNILSGKDLSLGAAFGSGFVGIGVVFTVIIGLLAGSYPAFYLTRFNPIDVLKGELRSHLRSYSVRNILVVFQFVISTTLIIATLTVYLQLYYIRSAKPGFDKTNVVNLLHTKNLGSQGEDFKKEILSNPDIVSASYASRLPPNVEWRSVFLDVSSGKEYIMAMYEMDADHLETMHYSMADGRFFSRENLADTNAIIVNEAAARKLGLANIIGNKLISNYDPDKREREVIGIIQDFNFLSLKEPVGPLGVVLGPEPNWEMAIRLTDGDREAKLEVINSLWKKYAPGTAFEYTWLEKNFEAKHSGEMRLGLISVSFSLLVISIACLGLFGLASFTADQRTKEIGIRKVMGAGTQDIVLMISKDFLKPVLIANVMAFPFAWRLMSQWLQQFAYRINFPWWVLFVSSLITLTVALLSVSFQSYHAAAGDPVKSLRNE